MKHIFATAIVLGVIAGIAPSATLAHETEKYGPKSMSAIEKEETAELAHPKKGDIAMFPVFSGMTRFPEAEIYLGKVASYRCELRGEVRFIGSRKGSTLAEMDLKESTEISKGSGRYRCAGTVLMTNDIFREGRRAYLYYHKYAKLKREARGVIVREILDGAK